MVRWLSAVLLLLVALASQAEPRLEARLDRDRVPENESLTLTLRLLGEISAAPDWSALTPEFDILHRSQETRMRLVDGGYRRETVWELGLMPRHAGVRMVPPIPVGPLSSEALAFERLPPAGAPVGGADVFVEASVSTRTPFVDSEVGYQVRLYLAVGARGTRLSEPRVIEGDATIRRLGEPRQFQSRRDGRNYLVWEQRYALVPQRSGALVIDAMTLEAQLSDPRQRMRISRFRSEPLALQVRPAVPIPPDLGDGPWLPARALSLALSTDTPIGELRAGEPLDLSLSLEAAGIAAAQLPDLPLASDDPRLRLYPDRAQSDEQIEVDGGTRARTIQRAALIATEPGSYPGLAVSLPWFNLETERWELASASLPAFQVLPPRGEHVAMAAPGSDAATESTDASGVAGALAAAAPPAPRTVDPWRLASLVLGLAWLFTFWLWRQDRQRTRVQESRRRSEGASGAGGATARAALKQLAMASRRDEPEAARDALLAWAATQWPGSPPRTVGEVSERLPPALAEPVRELSASLYGSAAHTWSGAGLASCVDSLGRLPLGGRPPARVGPLPPLWLRKG